MANYKLRKLNPDGKPFTDEQMRAVVLTVPEIPTIPPKPVRPGPKPDNMTWHEWFGITKKWYEENWQPYQGALDERELIVNQFAGWLAGEFVLMQVRPRNEYRIKHFMGGFVMFARNLTGYWKPKPADPVEYIVNNTITT